MKCLNKVTLIGNLGEAPELKYTANGKAVAKLRLATNEKWKNQHDELVGKTVWHQVVLWGDLASNAAQYLAKGDPVFIEGRIDNRSYEDERGETKYVSEVVASDVIYLPNGRTADKSSGENGAARPQSNAKTGGFRSARGK